jgi:uncharacterized protein YjbI with pentapeptide repeats
MQRATFVGAKITNTTFQEANMFEANLQGFHCYMCKFTRVELTRVDIRLTKMVGPSNFHHANLTDSRIDGSTLHQLDFYASKMERISSRNVTINKCTFRSAILVNSMFEWGTIRECDSTGAVMLGAILSYSRISTTNFQAANLSETDLSYVECYACNFTGADLTRSKLNNASFINCNFLDAVVTKEQLAFTISLNDQSYRMEQLLHKRGSMSLSNIAIRLKFSPILFIIGNESQYI